jgi:hypothetical protein
MHFRAMEWKEGMGVGLMQVIHSMLFLHGIGSWNVVHNCRALPGREEIMPIDPRL